MNCNAMRSDQSLRAIYREAVDPTARDDEPAGWWSAVETEIAAVIDAATVESAAAVISWWHYDWAQFSDTPAAAATRIRAAAAELASWAC